MAGVRPSPPVGDVELGEPTEARPRFAATSMPNHPAQQEIHRFAEEQPGLNIHELAARLGLSRSATRYHLRSLVRSGRIVTQRQGHHLLHFPGSMTVSQRRAVALLRINSVRLVVQTLVRSPVVQPARLASELGFSARSVRRSIKMLVGAGLARNEPDPSSLRGSRVTLHPDARLAWVLYCKDAVPAEVDSMPRAAAAASAVLPPIEAFVAFLAAYVVG